MTITNSTISGNTSGNTITSGGGGIFNVAGSTVTITNSTISGNTTSLGGGGIVNFGTLTITNSTVSSNSAGFGGGGIFNVAGSTVSLRNTIIALNTAPSGPDFSGALTSQGYNLIGNTSGTTITGSTTGNQLNVNPGLGPLQNNGGPTFTHALLSGSTAIEGGNSSGSNTDQRGLPRPVDSPVINNATGGDGSDIGAYEVQADQLPGCNTINRIVNNNNDSGTDSLRAVIANVCAGSTIRFAPNVTGAINLTSGELLLNKTLTINGPGANLLRVQRSAAAGNFRIFNIAGNVNVTISGLTIANGNSPGSNGGGIYNNGGKLTVSNSTLSGNSALSGAGGGGIHNNGGTLTITNSTVSSNSAGFGGGGINNFRSTVTITNSTISGNTITGGNGGGIYNSGDSTSGTVTVTNSTISGNSASDSSLGIGVGGGIHNGGGTVIITSSTISSNTAQFRGGGINNNGTLTARNTIIALNTSASGPDVFGTLTSQNFNLIGNNSGATITPAQFSDQIGTAGSPIDPLLSPLQNNGGPTLTRALLSGSPAIDRGHSSGSTTDQRGFTRPVGTANVNDGDGSDIGAFEIQLSCSYSINPISQAFPSSGGTNSVNVTATAGCTWTAQSNSPSFITITSGASGTGNGTVNYSVAVNTSASQRTGTITIAGQTFTVTQDGATPLVSNLQFSATNYSGAEDCAAAVVTVTRIGDSSGAVSVAYATSDGSALQRTDYTIALGTLSFASGETSKSFTVLITEDSFVEGTETATVTLSNPTGGAVLGSPSTATLTILDDATEPATNPIDVAGNYVCQHYHDFLNREPDAGGLAFWTDQITSCGSDAQCIEIRRINVSAAYFISTEFQQTGYLVYRFYNAALNRSNGLPRYLEFLRDTQRVGLGVVVGAPGWEAQLEANKVAYAAEFVERAEFTSLYPLSQTPAQFVDALYARAGIVPSAAERQAAIDEFNNPTGARARVLRRVAENQTYSQREFNRAFVLMQYLGYLRRNPDDAPDNDLAGYNFWLGKLNQFNGNFVAAEMVKAFITSEEYRRRFGAN